jgi:hypothetical protein
MQLSYRGKSGDAVPVHGGFTMKLSISGPDALTRQLRSSNALLALQDFRVEGNGRRTVPEAKDTETAVRTLFERAQVNGMFNSKPFRFGFDQAAPPADATQDQLEKICWALGMGGRSYKLASDGQYTTGDANADAHGEALAVIIDAAVRLPACAVQAGHEWTSDWVGVRKQKDSGATFRYHQVARLESLENGGTPTAHISFVTTAKLEFPPERGPAREETMLEGKGVVVLDLATGLPASTESSGTITTQLKAAGVKLVREIASKYEAR